MAVIVGKKVRLVVVVTSVLFIVIVVAVVVVTVIVVRVVVFTVVMVVVIVVMKVVAMVVVSEVIVIVVVVVVVTVVLVFVIVMNVVVMVVVMVVEVMVVVVIGEGSGYGGSGADNGVGVKHENMKVLYSLPLTVTLYESTEQYYGGSNSSKHQFAVMHHLFHLHLSFVKAAPHSLCLSLSLHPTPPLFLQHLPPSMCYNQHNKELLLSIGGVLTTTQTATDVNK